MEASYCMIAPKRKSEVHDDDDEEEENNKRPAKRTSSSPSLHSSSSSTSTLSDNDPTERTNNNGDISSSSSDHNDDDDDDEELERDIKMLDNTTDATVNLIDDNVTMNVTTNIHDLKKNLANEEEFSSINHTEPIHIFLKIKPLSQQEQHIQLDQVKLFLNLF